VHNAFYLHSPGKRADKIGNGKHGTNAMAKIKSESLRNRALFLILFTDIYIISDEIERNRQS